MITRYRLEFLSFFLIMPWLYSANSAEMEFPSKPVSIVEGTVIKHSLLPDALDGDYPNCNYTIRFQVNNLVSGELVPEFIIITAPAFRDWVKAATITDNSPYRMKIISERNASEDERNIMILDDLQDYELDNYYLNSFTPLSSLSTPDVTFANKPQYISPFNDPVNPPLSAKAVEMRERQMKSDLETLSKRLNDLGDLNQYEQWFKNIWLTNQKKYQRMGDVLRTGSQKKEPFSHMFWGRCEKGFFALPENHRLIRKTLLSADNLKALQSLNEFMFANNVQLIVAVNPTMYDLAAHVLNPELRDAVEYNSALICKQLLEAGIEAIYSADAILASADQYEYSFLYPENDHPGWGVQMPFAQLFAERIQRFDLEADLEKSDFSTDQAPGWCGKNFQYPMDVDIAPHNPGDVVKHDTILIKGELFKSDINSPILVYGNSYTQSPMTKSSLAAAIALKTGITPHQYYVGASGPLFTMPIRIFHSKNDFLKGKKVCLYYLAAYQWNAKHIDLREYDHMLNKISGMKLLSYISPEHFGMETTAEPVDVYSEQFMQANPLEKMLRIDAAPKLIFEQPTPKINDKLPDELMVSLTYAASVDATITMVVNGKEIQLPQQYMPCWTTVYFDIPSAANLSVKCFSQRSSNIWIKKFALHTPVENTQ